MPAQSRSQNGVASLAYGGLHVFLPCCAKKTKTRMAGTSPAMTNHPTNSGR
jgi:hypothetical protein